MTCMSFSIVCSNSGLDFIMHAFYFSSESRLEGWLAIPNRANIKRYGWKKQVRLVVCIKVLFVHLDMRDPPLTFVLFLSVCCGEQ